MVVIALFLAVFSVSPDEYWLARTIEGEGAFLTGDPYKASVLLLRTIENRRESKWCNSMEDCAVGAYWGIWRLDVPRRESVEMARRAMDSKSYLDFKGVYAFSLEDCRNLGLDPTDAIDSVIGNGVGLVFFPRETEF